ncbi:4-amino-4-deoxy-L-arabinose transferase-like glycosyltransferase [Granulicella mallensis]|uniref:4-amino-4-deoxy-L-arabinose transferase-like glycosyltransferase n=2 Tax=Granulicella mallensis TaxID=940614 RepID=A0A7W7ZUI8_9BACT|nr:4-amino-4-deoxy-L-arabinose transferase-like glycosyltransferase [Granulicella mallensis]
MAFNNVPCSDLRKPVYSPFSSEAYGLSEAGEQVAMSIRKLISSPVVWIALGLSLLTQATYFTLDHEHYGADTPSYLIPADNLLHGHGFVNALHQPELLRTPGYPLLLALFRIAPLKVEYLIVVQHLLCVLLAVAVVAIALQMTGSRLVACVAAIVMSLDLATLRVANLLLTEVVFMVLISLICWILYRAMMKPAGKGIAIAGAGLLGGYAVLVRPVGVLYFVPLSLCLFLVLRRRAWRPVLIFVAFFLILPVLWATRNFVEGGYFGISAIGAEDILYYRAAGAIAIERPGSYPANILKVNGELIQQTCADLEQMYHRDCSQITDKQQAAYASRKGMSIIREHPLSYLHSMTVSLAYLVFGGGAEALSRVSNVSPRIAEGIVLLFTVPEVCLALIGCRYWYRRDRILCWLLVPTIAYFLGISAGGEAYSRFKVPIMPMYALLIGGGAAGMVEWAQRARKPGVVSR